MYLGEQSRSEFYRRTRRGRAFLRRPKVKHVKGSIKNYPGAFGAVDVSVDPTKAQPAWLKTIADLAQTGLSVYQAERLRKTQMDRINKGLAPLSDNQIRALAPTANVNLALPKELQYGLLAGGAALIYLLVKKRR